MSLLATYTTKLKCSGKVFLIKCEKLFKKVTSIQACILRIRTKRSRLWLLWKLSVRYKFKSLNSTRFNAWIRISKISWVNYLAYIRACSTNKERTDSRRLRSTIVTAASLRVIWTHPVPRIHQNATPPIVNGRIRQAFYRSEAEPASYLYNLATACSISWKSHGRLQRTQWRSSSCRATTIVSTRRVSERSACAVLRSTMPSICSNIRDSLCFAASKCSKRFKTRSIKDWTSSKSKSGRGSTLICGRRSGKRITSRRWKPL